MMNIVMLVDQEGVEESSARLNNDFVRVVQYMPEVLKRSKLQVNQAVPLEDEVEANERYCLFADILAPVVKMGAMLIAHTVQRPNLGFLEELKEAGYPKLKICCNLAI